MRNFASHSFSVELATRIGLREAIILQHLYWWHQHNSSVRSMCIEGRVWFFLSAAKIRQAFPYLTERAVKTILEHLIKNGLLVKDHKGEGQDKFDRTNWYALTIDAIRLFDLTISANGTDENSHIVNSSSYNTPSNEGCNNISINPLPPKKFDFRAALLGLGVSEKVADEWLRVRKEKKAVNTELAFQSISAQIARSGRPADECIRIAVENSWRGFNADWLKDHQFAGTPSRRAAPAQKTTAVDRMLELGAKMFGPQTPKYDEQ